MRHLSLKHTAYIVSAIVIALSYVLQPIAYADDIDQAFYSGNDILFFDPTAGACVTSSSSWGVLTPEQKIGQLLFVGFDKASIDKFPDVAKKYQLGGVYINVQDPAVITADKIKAINSGMSTDLIVASDDEGGQVYRLLPKGSQPSAKKLGTMTPAQILAAGNDAGVKLKEKGITTVLAPVLDLDTGLKNAISPYDRSFSSDPSEIIQKAGAWAEGVSKANVSVVYKHFPGIGNNVGNTDLQYVTMNRSVEEMVKDLMPYRSSVVRERSYSSVMMANFVLPEWGPDPVSLNEKAVKYLREDIGYDGLIVTDDIGVMDKSGYGSHQLSIDQAVVKSLKAGVDMPLFGYPGDDKMDAIVSAVKKDVPVDRIDQAYQKMVAYKTAIGLNSLARSTTNSDGTTPVVAGNDNAQKIFNFLISTPFKTTGGNPFNAIQAAGALGNFFQESGYRFNTIQDGKSEVSPTSTVSGVGYGIAQWDGSRRKLLNDVAAKMGKPWSTPEVQFEMIRIELNDEAYPDGQKSSEGTRLAEFESGEFRTVTDARRASYLFMASYERAGTPAQENRDKEAVRMYEKYKNLAPGSAFSSASCTGGTTTSPSDGSLATFVTSDGYAVYIQSDPRWANEPYSSTTIGSAACGPASMTMIITALTGRAMDIKEVVKVSADAGLYVPGQGSKWTVGPVLAQHYGLQSKALPHTIEAVNEAVRGGAYVIMSGKGAVPFSSGGHYIHVRGVTADGKWLIGDSARKQTNETPYDPNFILSMSADNFYAISK